jgi:protein-tyrosine phosphatase
MIDLHCHLLPALDDGALDLDDSIAMGRQADEDGITKVCATPHIRSDHAVDVTELQERVDQLNAAFVDAHLRTRVLTGGEVAELSVPDLTDAELRLLTLGGGGRWILLEPAPGPLSESFVAAVDDLSARGFRTVVAHPERHLDKDAPELLARLIAHEALIQATAASFGEAGSELMLRLAARGMVHLLASDAHSSRFGRRVQLSDGMAALATVPELNAHLSWIANTAPEAIVHGDDVEAPFAAI